MLMTSQEVKSTRASWHIIWPISSHSVELRHQNIYVKQYGANETFHPSSATQISYVSAIGSLLVEHTWEEQSSIHCAMSNAGER